MPPSRLLAVRKVATKAKAPAAKKAAPAARGRPAAKRQPPKRAAPAAGKGGRGGKAAAAEEEEEDAIEKESPPSPGKPYPEDPIEETQPQQLGGAADAEVPWIMGHKAKVRAEGWGQRLDCRCQQQRTLA